MVGKRRSEHRRVQNVTTISTFPPAGLFAKDGETIARVMGGK